MEVFLPADAAARLAVGAEARIVLDVIPDVIIPAKVTFVSPQAQFTPKQVETAEERDKLMFRVRLTIPKELVLANIEKVKTGCAASAMCASISTPRGPIFSTSGSPAKAAKAMNPDAERSAASLAGISHHYGNTVALSEVSLDVPAERMVGLIGSDGVGKSTLLGLIAGVRRIQAGKVEALGGSMGDAAHLGVDRPHPRAPFGDDRDHGHRLHAEAEDFDHLIAMDEDRILATARAEELKQRTDAETLEEAFIAQFPEEKPAGHREVHLPSHEEESGVPAIEVEGLTMRFGDFTAVDKVSFRIGTGEIFGFLGFLGSNGCGKTTTMKMPDPRVRRSASSSICNSRSRCCTGPRC